MVVFAILQYVFIHPDNCYPVIPQIDKLTCNDTAFNAALVILGILLVCREKGISGQLVGVVDEIRTYPFRAVAALLKLDTGNRMVDRCRLYLETFIRTSGLYGERAHSCCRFRFELMHEPRN